jgi:hypothetical protein
MKLRDQRQLCGHPLTYATARVLLAGDTEAREEYMARGPTWGLSLIIKVAKLHTHRA